NCDYQKAAHVNVLAAFWIQFMTHDWFSHLDEGHNKAELMPMGCSVQLVGKSEAPLRQEQIKRLGCRPEDRIDKSLFAQETSPSTFNAGDQSRMTRAPKTTLNRVTAWWDASQIYGYDDPSPRRFKRARHDPAKLLLETGSSPAEPYLPILQTSHPQNPQRGGRGGGGISGHWD